MQLFKWKKRIVLSAVLIVIVGLFIACGRKILSDFEECKFIPTDAAIVTPEPSTVPSDTPELTPVPSVIPELMPLPLAITDLTSFPLTSPVVKEENTAASVNNAGVLPDIAKPSSIITFGREKRTGRSDQEETSKYITIAPPDLDKKVSCATIIIEDSDNIVKATETDKAIETDKANAPVKMGKTTAPPSSTEHASAEEEKTVLIYTGYIIDRDCFEDPGPEKDTLDCLLMESCRESGYGLAIKNGDAYEWFEFDAVGKNMAYEILKNTVRFKRISVTVQGILESNIFTVNDMYENTD